MNKTEISKKEIIKLVREQVKASAKKYKIYKLPQLTVLEESVRVEEDWWHVPVQPSTEPQFVAGYFEVLADVETQILEDKNLNVMLVPVLAGK